MVRLKVHAISRKLTFNLFQFHYGTIKRFIFKHTLKNLANFNSIMVRLKDLIELGTPSTITDFNSIMVRLKGRCKPDVQSPQRISIPLWYD